jgi:hypothetical protein
MARQVHDRDISKTLAAAQEWINKCLVEDRSVLSDRPLWTARLVDEVYHAFVEHPDYSKDDFITKLKHQMQPASAPAQQLLAEMLWALLLFPSNMKARTKRRQVREMWSLSGQQLPDDLPLMLDDVLAGIGSGGPGFANYRPDEMTFLIALARDLKGRSANERKNIFADYAAFVNWIKSVPQKGFRQFRHMLRFFAFPDRVERMSSNRDRRRILDAFKIAPERKTKDWTDEQLDDALLKLRNDLTKDNPSEVMDFYMPKYRERWAPEQKVKTPEGEVIVTVPDDDDEGDEEEAAVEEKAPEARQSIQMQAKLAEIGAIMGYRVWVPTADRSRVREIAQDYQAAFIEDHLPLSYDMTTVATIERIDVLWLDGRSIVRAFEVEDKTAVYSGLLRMADLLALIPNMDVRLHIVAPDERREKVFSELQRPVFSLVNRTPLSRRCTFISYDSVQAMRNLEHLAYTNDRIINEYEERAEA